MNIVLRDYARNGRRWEGQVPTSEFVRLTTDLSQYGPSVAVCIDFSIDENSRIHVKGEAQLDGSIDCHRCSAAIRTTIRAEIDAVIVRSDDVARELATDCDVILVSDTAVSVVDLIEDDLIMSIPWRVCTSGDDCVNLRASRRRLQMARRDSVQTHLPFRNLRDLLKQ